MIDAKRTIREALQADRGDNDPGLDGAVVIGYVAIVEWMAPDGERWLSAISGDASDEPLMRWQIQGYLHNILHDPAWHDEADADVDDA